MMKKESKNSSEPKMYCDKTAIGNNTVQLLQTKLWQNSPLSPITLAADNVLRSLCSYENPRRELLRSVFPVTRVGWNILDFSFFVECNRGGYVGSSKNIVIDSIGFHPTATPEPCAGS
jgi:hypothetical protein